MSNPLRQLKTEDIEMSVTFRTRCGRCGNAYQVSSELCVPEPGSFQFYVAKMRKHLQETPRTCCEKTLPVIEKEWERVWIR